MCYDEDQQPGLGGEDIAEGAEGTDETVPEEVADDDILLSVVVVELTKLVAAAIDSGSSSVDVLES